MLPVLEPATVEKIHVAVLGLCVVGYFAHLYKLEAATADVKQINKMLEALRRDIHSGLKESLSPLLEDVLRPPVVAVDPAAYRERFGSLVDSEKFGDAIRDFAAARSGSLSDYGSVIRLRDSIEFWRRWLARTALILIVVALLSEVFVVIAPQIFAAPAVPLLCTLTLYPVAGLIAAAVVSIAILRFRHDRLAKIGAGLPTFSA